jgi:tRNA nucleotidyltransferase (CCA-adding enzyme)
MAVNLSPAINQVLNGLVNAGGAPFLVGGFVRDTVMGKPSKDFDIEVYNLAPNAFLEEIQKHGKVKLVGESFGVFKLTLRDGSDLDLSLPRTENRRNTAQLIASLADENGIVDLKVNAHTDFDVDVDPFMPIEVAASRRDFTMNAMVMNPFTGHIIDPFNGRQDIRNGLLRATSAAFAEDPLRVLRGMQFAARFNMQVEFFTMQMAKKLMGEFQTIATERIWGEWEKFFQKGTHPHMGLKFLRDTGWLGFFPEVENLIGTVQEPDWHPEGDVWTHTSFVMRQMALIIERDGLKGDDSTIAMAGALCHDMGKPLTTTNINGQIRSPGHDKEGLVPTRDFMTAIGAPEKITLPVMKLVEEHMSHIGLHPTARIVRRLAQRLHPHTTITMWERIVEADASGRPPLPKSRPAEAWLALAKEVQSNEGLPKPLVGGAMLIARNFKPGPAFKPILDAAFSAQLDGFVTPDNAEEWLDTFLLEGAA